MFCFRCFTFKCFECYPSCSHTTRGKCIPGEKDSVSENSSFAVALTKSYQRDQNRVLRFGPSHLCAHRGFDNEDKISNELLSSTRAPLNLSPRKPFPDCAHILEKCCVMRLLCSSLSSFRYFNKP